MHMHTRTIGTLAAAVATMIIVSCGRPERVSNDQKLLRNYKATEIEKWTESGWTFVEVVGDEIPEALPAVHLGSDTARMVTAIARRPDGEPVRKRYSQEEKLYLVVTMDGGPKGSYCLVFSKAK
jgi:hypothetical protein